MHTEQTGIWFWWCVHNAFYSLQERGVGLVLVDLVADVVDVSWEVVLGVVVDDVTDVREDHVMEDSVLQVLQEPASQTEKALLNISYIISNKDDALVIATTFVWGKGPPTVPWGTFAKDTAIVTIYIIHFLTWILQTCFIVINTNTDHLSNENTTFIWIEIGLNFAA